MDRKEEVLEKRRRVLQFMKERGLDGVLFTQQNNFAWYTAGGRNFVALASVRGAASILVTPERDYVITDNIEAPRIEKEELEDLGFDLQVFQWYNKSGEKELLSRLTSGGKIIEDTGPLADDLARLRYSLTERELQRYRDLGKRTAEGMNTVARNLRIGDTEFEIAGRLAEEMFSRGLEPIVLLIAFDERIEKFRHPLPTDKKLSRYAMLVVCTRQGGLILSMTRLVHFGKPTDELRRKHDAVVKVDASFIANTKVGTPVNEIFKRAIRAYQETGYPEEWKLHHQGGATGYSPRDYKGSLDCREVVLNNQAFAWNPSITGTKSEDTILVTQKGPEIISEIEGWPTIPVEVGGEEIPRPDILVL